MIEIEHGEWQRDLYRDLHRIPETALAERRTSARIAAEVEALGLKPVRVGATGLVTTLENGDGQAVAFRADFDGLPVTEQTGLEYAATNGNMHACGHDFHTAALIGTLRWMVEHRKEWAGTFVAVFQPGEETAEGARDMVAGGLTSACPRPDVLLGQHVNPGPWGTIMVRPGVIMSQADSIRITVFGRGAHGSMPHASVDAALLAATIVVSLQSVVARNVSPADFSVVTVGAIHAGSAANVIPASAEIKLNLRHYDAGVRARVISRIEEIVRAACVGAGADREPEFEYYSQFPLTVNDPAVTERVVESFAAEFGDGAVLEAERQTGSEDFPVLADAWGVPSAYWFVGGYDPEVVARASDEGRMGIDVPMNHSPFFAPSIDPTLEVMTRAALAASLAYLRRS